MINNNLSQKEQDRASMATQKIARLCSHWGIPESTLDINNPYVQNHSIKVRAQITLAYQTSRGLLRLSNLPEEAEKVHKLGLRPKKRLEKIVRPLLRSPDKLLDKASISVGDKSDLEQLIEGKWDGIWRWYKPKYQVRKCRKCRGKGAVKCPSCGGKGIVGGGSRTTHDIQWKPTHFDKTSSGFDRKIGTIVYSPTPTSKTRREPARNCKRCHKTGKQTCDHCQGDCWVADIVADQMKFDTAVTVLNPGKLPTVIQTLLKNTGTSGIAREARLEVVDKKSRSNKLILQLVADIIEVLQPVILHSDTDKCITARVVGESGQSLILPPFLDKHVDCALEDILAAPVEQRLLRARNYPSLKSISDSLINNVSVETREMSQNCHGAVSPKAFQRATRKLRRAYDFYGWKSVTVEWGLIGIAFASIAFLYVQTEGIIHDGMFIAAALLLPTVGCLLSRVISRRAAVTRLGTTVRRTPRFAIWLNVVGVIFFVGVSLALM